MKKHESAKEVCLGLIQTLDALVDFCPFQVALEHERFAHFLLGDPPRVEALLARDSRAVEDISQNDLLLTDLESNRTILSTILYAMRLQYDRKTFFLPPHPLQAKFDQFLFHPNFVLSAEVAKLAADFDGQRALLMEQMIETFQLTDPIDLSVFSIVFFRSVFDFAYETRPEMFRQDTESRIRRHTTRYRPQDTGAALKFIPPHPDGATLADIVKTDQSMEDAAKELTAAAFCNSPLDVLWCIHLALTNVRKFVAKTDPEMVQSLDTVFGLFLIVLLGCDLPNPEALFDMVETYAPVVGLSGPLEYARSTVSAASMQCKTILQNYEKPD
jgi:hypothetical protein